MQASDDVTIRLVDLPELSRITSLKRSAIYSRIQAGEFRPIKLGRKTVFSEAEVRAWVHTQITKAHAA